MADLLTFTLFFSLLVLVGCFITKPTKREFHDAQHYLQKEHEQQLDQYRKDGRLPPKKK